jgi:dipeptidyl aminopeptidase/acylaminoacyl peptidase
VKAAATVGAFSDLDSLFAADPNSAAMAPKIWPDYASRKGEIAFRRSALRWADRSKVPILLLHGENDHCVPPRLSRLLDAKLTAPHELHVLPGGSHTLGEQSAVRDSLVVEWFRRH